LRRKNYKVGDKVLLALPGAVLPGDFKIKVGKLRGVESHGMMCSAKELGLGEDGDGLLILPPTTEIGTPIAQLFPGDTILDLEITPNRPDLLSMVGIAREIGALLRRPVKLPQLRDGQPVVLSIDVEITVPTCPLYSARKIEGVKVGASPQWLVRKLESVGLHSINNVVDVTNYVMMEIGQPLHAFDAAKLQGKLAVRSARPSERLRALDKKSYTLASDDIVIADDEGAVAIGGVIGGEDSAVTDTTSAVWLEAAEFQSQSIRRTARRLGIVTDSSYRFERGVDPEAVLYASQRATELIIELAGGETSAPLRLGRFHSSGQSALPTATTISFPTTETVPLSRDKHGEQTIVVAPLGQGHGPTVELRTARVSQLLGDEVRGTEIESILSRLGLKRGEAGKWIVPSFRRADLLRGSRSD
jgi:phenylalanyl-tRNA synthetase beta chain